MARKWIRRGFAIIVLSLLAAVVWAGSNWDSLQVRYAAHRLTTATTDDDRAKWADALTAHGDEGERRLLDLVRTGDPTLRTAAAAALGRHLETLPENDPHAAHRSEILLELFVASDDACRESLVEWLPTLVSRGGPLHRARCKDAVAIGLKLPSVSARLAAIRAALQPQVAMRAELVALLAASEAEVRRAALFAVGPATDAEAVVGDEELFRWLHDPDRGVRAVCHDALVSRGRSDGEIALGRRLVEPEPGERLKLLLDLRYDDDVADPEPWLERMSHDVDPGVRAGAARVMMELSVEKRSPAPAWVAQLAEGDPELAVRRIARYYRSLPNRRSEEGLRPIGGP